MCTGTRRPGGGFRAPRGFRRNRPTPVSRSRTIGGVSGPRPAPACRSCFPMRCTDLMAATLAPAAASAAAAGPSRARAKDRVSAFPIRKPEAPPARQEEFARRAREGFHVCLLHDSRHGSFRTGHLHQPVHPPLKLQALASPRGFFCSGVSHTTSAARRMSRRKPSRGTPSSTLCPRRRSESVEPTETAPVRRVVGHPGGRSGWPPVSMPKMYDITIEVVDVVLRHAEEMYSAAVAGSSRRSG